MPFFRSPVEDFRIISRSFSRVDRHSYVRWVAVWFAIGGGILTGTLLGMNETASQIALRLWLFGGAAYALKQGATFAPLKEEEQISTFAALIFIVGILFVGLLIGGSILTLLDEDGGSD